MRDLLSTALLYVGMIGSLFAEGKETIQVLPVPRTPESKTVLLAIAFPESQEVVPKNPVWVQFRLDGYPLGAGSQFDRADEVVVSSMGQTVHVIVDNQPYFPVEQPAIDPFNEEGSYYDTSYKFRLLDSLSEGLHTIRMFPARSFGESLKGERTFFATTSLGSDKKMALPSDLLIFAWPSIPGRRETLGRRASVLIKTSLL